MRPASVHTEQVTQLMLMRGGDIDTGKRTLRKEGKIEIHRAAQAKRPNVFHKQTRKKGQIICLHNAAS
jgi:hypothetical protein